MSGVAINCSEGVCSHPDRCRTIGVCLWGEKARVAGVELQPNPEYANATDVEIYVHPGAVGFEMTSAEKVAALPSVIFGSAKCPPPPPCPPRAGYTWRLNPETLQWSEALITDADILSVKTAEAEREKELIELQNSINQSAAGVLTAIGVAVHRAADSVPKSDKPEKNIDARWWANEFMLAAMAIWQRGESIDVDFMTTWFANSLMAGWEAAGARAARTAAKEIPILRQQLADSLKDLQALEASNAALLRTVDRLAREKHARHRPNIFERARGWVRISFGFCPRCNSDAPELDTCTVCQGYRSSQAEFPPAEKRKEAWWERFKDGR